MSECRKWFMKEFDKRNYDSIVFGSSVSRDEKFRVIVRAGVFKENGVNKVCLLDLIKEKL